MKNYSLLSKLVVCCAFGLMRSPLYAQGRTLTAAQLDAIVNPTLESCSTPRDTVKRGRLNPASIIPTKNARQFPTARVARTLHGMWRGRVVGDDKDVSVDYFWIFDTRRGEALIIAQRTGKQTMAALTPVANAPKLTYLLCAHEGYYPSKETPQMQEFVKVSNNIDEAPRILQQATGLKPRRGVAPTLSEMWRGLVAMKYFETLNAVAFAGGFFKPLTIGRVESEIGPAQVSMKWDAQYYGGGSTSIAFTKAVPITGVEYGQFVGTTTRSGDFLVASLGNGRIWKVEARTGGHYDLGFDWCTLGPLQP